MIDGSSLTDTNIVCQTGSHSRTIKTTVLVEKVAEGNALLDNVRICVVVRDLILHTLSGWNLAIDILDILCTAVHQFVGFFFISICAGFFMLCVKSGFHLLIAECNTNPLITLTTYWANYSPKFGLVTLL